MNKDYNNEFDGNGDKGDNNKDNTSYFTGSYSSPILITKYAQEAVKLIGVLEKNFVLIVGVICALGVLSILDILQAQGHIHIIISDNGYDITVTVFSLISLAVFVPTIMLLLKSRRTLESWAATFDRNSIKASINIAMATKSKEEAIWAVSETVEEIGEPLQTYLSSSRDNLRQFIDVSVNSNANDLLFDVLIDEDRIPSGEGNNLKQALKEYGSIVIRVVDGTIDRNAVQMFYNLVSKYVSFTKNKVGLALIIGEAANQDAYEAAIRYENKKRLKHLVIAEKQVLRP
jgi:hypothetical protein